MTNDNKRELLVVDDDRLIRMVMGKYLENEGHRVSFAVNGREALDMLARQTFEMILLDIEMPEMNGYQVLEQVMANPRWRDIPVIVTSAVEQMESVVRCIQMGAEDYLTKPVNRVLLKARIDASLEKKRLRDQQTAHLQRLEREMEFARQTQLSILPESLPQTDPYSLGALMIPAQAVGGDFFDVINLGEDQWGVVVGDVSGKGLPAALFMTLTYSLLRTEAARHVPPKQALHNVNRALMGMNSTSMFVTVICGILDVKGETFSYARAGHPSPLSVSSAGQLLDIPSGKSQALGLFDKPFIDENTIHISEGGLVVLYSDGLSEATDAAGNQFGETRLPKFFCGQMDRDPQTICNQLWEVVGQFCGESPQQDDFTLVLIKSLKR